MQDANKQEERKEMHAFEEPAPCMYGFNDSLRANLQSRHPRHAEFGVTLYFWWIWRNLVLLVDFALLVDLVQPCTSGEILV